MACALREAGRGENEAASGASEVARAQSEAACGEVEVGIGASEVAGAQLEATCGELEAAGAGNEVNAGANEVARAGSEVRSGESRAAFGELGDRCAGSDGPLAPGCLGEIRIGVPLSRAQISEIDPSLETGQRGMGMGANF